MKRQRDEMGFDLDPCVGEVSKRPKGPADAAASEEASALSENLVKISSEPPPLETIG